MSDAVTRRAAMKTALKAGAYAVPILITVAVPAGVAALSPSLPMADLFVRKTVDNPAPFPFTNVTFTVSVSNNGPNDATGVTVLDKLPAGLTFVSATPAAAYNTTTGIWTVGALPNSGSATLLIVTTVTQAASPSATNLASVSHSDQGDPNPSNNSDSATVTPLVIVGSNDDPVPSSGP
ncbi:MAG: DUF11 domain-containing protein [Chloroflexota bacterium]|nr:DUF11 domain-containing protein [Chloroflexota bacterium]